MHEIVPAETACRKQTVTCQGGGDKNVLDNPAIRGLVLVLISVMEVFVVDTLQLCPSTSNHHVQLSASTALFLLKIGAGGGNYDRSK